MSDSLVQELRATIDKLENRLKDVEDRMLGHGEDNSSATSTTTSGAQGMRMILIGPPGAGELCAWIVGRAIGFNG